MRHKQPLFHFHSFLCSQELTKIYSVTHYLSDIPPFRTRAAYFAKEMSEMKVQSMRMAAKPLERSAVMCKCVSNNGSQRKHAIFRGEKYKATKEEPL